MTIYLRLAPQDEPVYQFLDTKLSEGKPYYVYMTAGANKFLRIYYARVRNAWQIWMRLPWAAKQPGNLFMDTSQLMRYVAHRQLCCTLFYSSPD